MNEEKPSTSKQNEYTSNNEQEKKPISDRSLEEEDSVESIRKFFAQKLNLLASSDQDNTNTNKVIESLTFDGLCDHWKSKGFKHIITMVGAGISTSAGIPDFRSPDSGIYNNLQKYNLPRPSAVFEIDYFDDKPQAFFTLAKELYPGSFNPTPAHYFVRLLHEKGLLLRHYTQNIDTLERVAGIPEEKLVEAHGTFYTNHCRGCHKSYSMEWVKEQVFADRVPTCTDCNCVVKPDIVFFGENLPEKFHTMPCKDFSKCDLLIIMGTSLEVQPFASLVDRAGPNCVRFLINRTKVQNDFGSFRQWLFGGQSFMFDDPKNVRDIAYIGDCDDAVWALVKALGWSNDLKDLMQKEKQLLEEKSQSEKKSCSTR